jgi:flagellar protein FliL
MSDAAATAARPAKRGKLIPLIVALVVLGGAGGGFWFWRQSAATAAGHEPVPEKEKPAAVLALEPFLVNLADPQASRFLRVTVRLVVEDEAFAHEFEKEEVPKARVRSAILELLTTQTSDTLVTAEGKTALKEAIAKRSSEVLKLEVTDVLFTDFVVQF